MKCRHSWEFTGQTRQGEDRVIRHYACRLCPKKTRRNVKKPRFTATLRRKPSLPSKAPKTPQERPVSKRKAIKPVSDKRKNWLKQYEAKKKAEGSSVMAWGTHNYKSMTPTMLTERHHPLGRIGCRVLFYRHVTREFHEWIHDNAKQARNLGFILPEMSGRESGPDQPDPFGILSEYRAYVAEHGMH